MDYKKLLCSVMLLGSLGSSTLVAYGEETIDSTGTQESSAIVESSSSIETSAKTQDTSEEADKEAETTTTSSTEQAEETMAVDEVEYDALGNLQFHHPIPFEEFTIEPPAFRAARSSVSTQQAFINQIAPSAKSLASANDLYASVMIAQAIVESGWGSSTLSKAPNYNLFGIKGEYNGQSVTMKTQEWSQKEGWHYVDAKFRKYPSYKESLGDNVTVLKKTSFSSGNYYYSGAWKSNTKSYKDATAYLTGRYATAPTYGSTLNSVIETYKLTQYDTTSNGGSTPAPVQTNAMYRLYNPNSGEHFYTASTAERDKVKKAGWRYEGIGWQAPKSGTPVYRLYNPNAGDHHYTPNVAEKNNLVKVGWRYEGVSWYSGGSKPLYRLYNPNAKSGAHHYTLLQSERNNLIKQGWRNEGTGWYGQ
ncbi:glycoside hydrolase family 73 protein [Enterococcus hulanensis]|uniref:Glycoside hydrolase family 73 protein n=1 Tax=Enterococcus hulanensis TaxID=2559929 RepID=A0ABU3EXR8_9ENTE|nr:MULTISPECIES: glycoside hydrolase family 73 protein [Enterococcus]MBO0412514.1 glycoside hydrolase family 73 protein [Enterococcus hulanensis]MDT2599663.1 glycoside hydrolase family 73 protein [Enterococcus hulanensis]MDT2609481.1 glycoside hydrolase family 73 protein [Enterococcus hulanensis]MDT2616058.1 glycoside hydrolase family 73 protein [Enterococcus hulanensis]MDT2627902.1 glycoside hydrolase family 73 protein [Enterococcus hulanensis]